PRAERGGCQRRLAVEIRPTGVPAPLLDAVDAEVPRATLRRQEDVFLEDAILLAADEDLAGEQQRVQLASIVDEQCAHARLRALRDGERALGTSFVKSSDVERRRVGCVEPDYCEAAVTLGLAKAHIADEASEVLVRLPDGNELVLLAHVSQ